ncbi:hypothetical protein [Yersinia alsatica]|uniref:hypothetical protein n=1 Tax=Yersinia alsatica TaxID=2890317 RepID=UPI00119EE7DB|nr:hypothetical protein [Yersinia alsatica]
MQIGNSNSSLNSILESDDKQPLLDELPDRYTTQTECKIVEPLGSSYELLGSEYLSSIESCKPPVVIENEKILSGVKLSNYVSNVNKYVESKEMNSKNSYVENYLLENVNRNGKAPLLLRPLAALLALFGIHGFGQQNCVSCATAVIDSLENNMPVIALSNLRGATVAANMVTRLHEGISTEELIDQLSHYKKSDELNTLLAIRRPAIMRMLPGATQGHACNLIKFKDSNVIHFLDTQKRTHFSCNVDQVAEKSVEINKFIGSVGAGGIDVWKGRPKDIYIKPEQ